MTPDRAARDKPSPCARPSHHREDNERNGGPPATKRPRRDPDRAPRFRHGRRNPGEAKHPERGSRPAPAGTVRRRLNRAAGGTIIL